MANWINEFGSGYAVPAEVTALPVNDISWHNDIAPSFEWQAVPVTDSATGLRLWVEHPDIDMRECPAARFTVTYREETVCLTDDVTVAIAVFTSYRDQALQALSPAIDALVTIAKRLKADHKLRATVEYPGFIAVWAEDLVSHPDWIWAFGTANGTWEGDLQDGTGVYQGQTKSTVVLATEQDTAIIAAAIAQVLSPR